MRFLSLYAQLIQKLRAWLASTGALQRLDQAATSSRSLLWVRSLLSVLDFDDFRELDLPWWTFTAAERVDKYLREKPDARVFEWGSGASTVWLSKRASEVYSVESEPEWAAQVATAVGPNVHLQTTVPPALLSGVRPLSCRFGYRSLDFSAYVDAIDLVPGNFDLIVIDGRARQFCLPKALSRLAPGGMVVFDNTNRLRYRRALKQWAHVTSETSDWGLTPILPWPSMTTTLVMQEKPQAANAVRVTTR